MAPPGPASSADDQDRTSPESTGARRPIIGLTGGIGAGKSAVASILEDEGCLVCRSDELARQALRDPVIRRTLVDWWGPEILDPSGEADRRAVAEVVFGDPDERRRLERLTHPWIEARRRRIFERAGPEVVALVIDAPLLMEAGLDRECDAIIFVDAPIELRRERVRRDRGWADGELDRREESQLPLDAKRGRADHVIRNDASLVDLTERVRASLASILHTTDPSGERPGEGREQRRTSGPNGSDEPHRT